MTATAMPSRKNFLRTNAARVADVAHNKKPRSFAARTIGAIAELKNWTVDDLAECIGTKRTLASQLRSGARSDLRQAGLVFAAAGLDPDTTISRLAQLDIEGDVSAIDDLLTALVLTAHSQDRHNRMPSENAILSCDKIALLLQQAVVARRADLIERALDRGERVSEWNYRRASKYRGVFVGLGPRWKPWRGTGLKLEFNPSKLRRRGLRFVRAILSACAPADVVTISRIDVAVDLQIPLGWYQPFGTARRKHTVVGTVSDIETIYLGSKPSHFSLTAYDKEKELRKRGLTPPWSPMTRIEARHKKRKWRPVDILAIQDPFREVRGLWLDDTGLEFPDVVLTRLGRLFGWPMLRRVLAPEHFTRLLDHYQRCGDGQLLIHPTLVFHQRWPEVARRLLRRLGIRVDSPEQLDSDIEPTMLWRWRAEMARTSINPPL